MPSASFQVSPQVLADVISTAFEGGSVGWCASANPSEGYINTENKAPWYAQNGFWQHDFHIEIVTREGEQVTLNHVDFHKRFRDFVVKYPSSVGRMVEGQYDAYDADRLWQFVVFNEVVYG